jgi:putative oxidoreductase
MENTLPDLTSVRIAWQSVLLSVTRIMIGLLLMEHGTAKVLDFPHPPNHAPFALISLNPGAQGLLELVGGCLMVLGLFTRPVAFILAGDMAVAYFMAHAPRGLLPLLNGGELAIVYCFVFLYFSLAGSGAWGVDRLRAPASGRVRVPPSWEEVGLAEPWTVARVSGTPEPAGAELARESARVPEPASAGAGDNTRRSG